MRLVRKPYLLERDRDLDPIRRRQRVKLQTIGMLRRTLARLDVTSRTMFALVGKGSCFAGTLLELALAADRQYMLALSGDAARPRIALSEMNFGAYPAVHGQSRLAARFYGAREIVEFDALKHVPAWLERGLARPAVQRGLEIPKRP